MTTASAIFAIVRFQVVWLIFVIGAGNGVWWPGLLAAAVLLMLHLLYSANRILEIAAFGLAILVAFAAEVIFASLGPITYSAHWPESFFAPVWIFGLWLALATAIPATRHLLASNATLKSIPLGLIFGPLAYIGAAQYQAITIEPPYWQSVAIIGLTWAAAFPAMVMIFRRLSPEDNASQC